VKPRGKKPFTVSLRVPGMPTAWNALAAAAVGLKFGVPPARISAALNGWTAVGKRMEIIAAGGVTILNDTYNANSDSVIAALDTALAIPGSGKKILILADMLELGDTAAAEHDRVGDAIRTRGFQYLLTYGDLAKRIGEKAKSSVSLHYDQKNVLAEYAAELAAPGDVILVKGSRGMKMEDVVLFLTERLRAQEAVLR